MTRETPYRILAFAVLALIDWLRSDPRAHDLMNVALMLARHDGRPNAAQAGHTALADEIRRR